jgi:LmbE family N-acetylglucosaminyl deacetylase
MLNLASALGGVSKVLFIGAHSDDIEIGCGGTVLKLLDIASEIEIDWIVLSAGEERKREAEESAGRFLEGAHGSRVQVGTFRERYFPFLPELKEYFDALGRELEPDLIFCPRFEDRHQDHRVVAELTANTFRDHMILNYEIPKFDADLGQPGVFVPLSEELVARKIRLLLGGFPSQRQRTWFSEETFRGLLRIRGVESGTGFAEAFDCRKLVFF